MNYLERNPDKRAASHLFEVGIATIHRWVARKKLTGNERVCIKKIDDQKLIEYLQAHPNHFLSEIAKHFGLTPQAIFYTLKRLKITRKKRLQSIKREMKK